MLLSTQSLTYSYPGRSPHERPALADVSIEIPSGDRVAIVGPSGAGKTSLLYCLAGVLPPAQGDVYLDGSPFGSLRAADRASVRLEKFGFIFQFGELLAELTLRENVTLPLQLLGWKMKQSAARADELLTRLGIADVADRRPSLVSGGQAQRAAVARAVVHGPEILFADEPTGSLDALAGHETMNVLLSLASESGTTLVVVTHNDAVAELLDRRFFVTDGVVTNERLSCP
jgi:putative ABC transport system ATP-binding protein